MTKQCELCDLPARMFCESDQASLCWECDATVHGANFLVARHFRRLLCRSCQAPTPWRASGSRLGTTVSVCNRCLGDNSAEASDSGAATRDGEGGCGEGGSRGGSMEGGGDIGEEEEDSEEDEDEEEDDEDEDEDENEDGDNQVVPWSSEADAEATASPPSAASCLSSDESSSGRMHVYYGLLKRRRVDDDLPSSHCQEDAGCSPSQHGYLRFPAATAVYPGRMLEEEEEEGEEAASCLGCSFRGSHGPDEGGSPPARIGRSVHSARASSPLNSRLI